MPLEAVENNFMGPKRLGDSVLLVYYMSLTAWLGDPTYAPYQNIGIAGYKEGEGVPRDLSSGFILPQ